MTTATAEHPRRSALAPRGAVCATPGCGTILSAYRPEGETLCALCRRKRDDAAARAVDLERLVAGILLTHDALHPGDPVDVGMELAGYGVDVDAETVKLAVRHIGSRHGIVARGRRGQPGYTVAGWELRYRLAVNGSGAPMDRDAATGQWSGVLPELQATNSAGRLRSAGRADCRYAALMGSQPRPSRTRDSRPKQSGKGTECA
jgi:hypothetical protein